MGEGRGEANKGYKLREDIGSVFGVTDLFGRPLVVNADLTARVDDGISGGEIDEDYTPGYGLFTGELEHVQFTLFGDNNQR